MPRPQMPKPENPSNTATPKSESFVAAQRQNVSRANADARAAQAQTKHVAKILKNPPTINPR